jgi:hypothetical protein
MYLAAEVCTEEVVRSWKIKRSCSVSHCHILLEAQVKSRPWHSSSGTRKSSNISVQQSDITVAAVSWSCPKKQWLIMVKAATAHHTVSFSLCIGLCWSWR